MAQPDRFDEPGSPGGTEPRKPLEFPNREDPRTISVWRITIYTVLILAILAGITLWLVYPR
jgi:hypothetical protein